jgi:hypothetical protein
VHLTKIIFIYIYILYLTRQIFSSLLFGHLLTRLTLIRTRSYRAQNNKQNKRICTFVQQTYLLYLNLYVSPSFNSTQGTLIRQKVCLLYDTSQLATTVRSTYWLLAFARYRYTPEAINETPSILLKLPPLFSTSDRVILISKVSVVADL